MARRLEHAPPSRDREQPAAKGSCPSTVALAQGVDRAWFDQDPPPLPVRKPDQEVDKRRDQFPGNTHFAYTEWNLRFLRKLICEDHDTNLFRPDAQLYTFESGDDSPRFRLLRGITVPEGMYINAFGFRGPELALCPPPNTIRIAFVGASTTLSSHSFAYSYPEHLIHWLNLWAEKNHPGLRFEGINCGRYAARVSDMVGTVRDQALPLRPDLLLYYEGYNDFASPFLQPSTGGVARLKELCVRAWLLGEKRSALLRRLRSVDLNNPGALPEPLKPLSHRTIPEALDPAWPDYRTIRWTHVPQHLDVLRTLSQEAGARMVVSTFLWCIPSASMPLQAPRDLPIFNHLQASFPTVSYDDLRFHVALHNNMLKRYAKESALPLLDTAARFPTDPSLFTDAIHLGPFGNKVQAWVMLQELLPVIQDMLRQGYPRRSPCSLRKHPGFPDPDVRRTLRPVDIQAGCAPS